MLSGDANPQKMLNNIGKVLIYRVIETQALHGVEECLELLGVMVNLLARKKYYVHCVVKKKIVTLLLQR
jgi:hypothetical protein